MSKAFFALVLLGVIVLTIVGYSSYRQVKRNSMTVGAAFDRPAPKTQEIKGFRVISERVYVAEIKAFVTEIEVDGRRLFYISDINQYSSVVVERQRAILSQ
jgi:hypothetical protein